MLDGCFRERLPGWPRGEPTRRYFRGVTGPRQRMKEMIFLNSTTMNTRHAPGRRGFHGWKFKATRSGGCDKQRKTTIYDNA